MHNFAIAVYTGIYIAFTAVIYITITHIRVPLGKKNLILSVKSVLHHLTLLSESNTG